LFAWFYSPNPAKGLNVVRCFSGAKADDFGSERNALGSKPEKKMT